jgi:hypothetical protein
LLQHSIIEVSLVVRTVVETPEGTYARMVTLLDIQVRVLALPPAG